MKAVYKLNEKLNGIEITFDAKPSEAVRTQLKEYGFRWSPKKSIWYAHQTDETLSFSKVLCYGDIGEMDTPGTETGRVAVEKPAPVNQYGVKPGDLFVETFGYDATLHTFYEVTAIKGKVMVELREVGCDSRNTGAMSWDTKPIKGKFIGDPITKKTKPGWDGKSVLAGNMCPGSWDKWYENDNYH